MKNIWKIMLALALVLCLSFSLIACGGSDDDGDNTPGTSDNGDTTPDGGNGGNGGNGGADDNGNNGDNGGANDPVDQDGNLSEVGVNNDAGFGPVTPAN